MKIYLKDEVGNLLFQEMVISPSAGNSLYLQALAEEEAGEAEILPYVKPEPTQEELNAPHIAYLERTDWYVVRMADIGVKMPASVIKNRKAARAAVI